MIFTTLLLSTSLAGTAALPAAEPVQQLLVKARRGQFAPLEQRMDALAPDATRRSAFPNMRADRSNAVGLDRILVVELPANRIAGVAAALADDARVEWLERNVGGGGGLSGSGLFPDDPSFGGQWALDQPSDIDLDMPEAWARQGGLQLPSEVVVAVIDSGFDFQSTSGELDASLWTNAGEIAGDGIDNDGNGYVDDVHGYDFDQDDGTPDAVLSHGVQVTGILGSRANNGTQIAGVASGASIMPLRSFNAGGTFPTTGPYPGSLAPALAIRYAVDNGAAVINNSWFNGSTPSLVINEAIDYAIENGVQVVFAASNAGATVSWPAQHPDVIAVAAVDAQGQRSIWGSQSSNYGSWVDLSAGGTGILTTALGGFLSSFNGTSAAAPLVAGVVALVEARDADLAPHEMRALLQQAAVDVDALNPGFEGLLGTGFANADRSLELLEPVSDLGGQVPGASRPVLNAWGGTQLGEQATLSISGAWPGQRAALVVGLRRDDASVLGGTLVPSMDFVFSDAVRSDGTFSVEFTLNEDLPSGFALYAQFLVRDSGAPGRVAFSNAVAIEAL